MLDYRVHKLLITDRREIIELKVFLAKNMLFYPKSVNRKVHDDVIMKSGTHQYHNGIYLFLKCVTDSILQNIDKKYFFTHQQRKILISSQTF